MSQSSEKIKYSKKNKCRMSLCWGCKNVFFNKCKKPVVGWNAIENDLRYPVKLLDTKTHQLKTVIVERESWFVYECPNFIPDD